MPVSKSLLSVALMFAFVRPVFAQDEAPPVRSDDERKKSGGGSDEPPPADEPPVDGSSYEEETPPPAEPPPEDDDYSPSWLRVGIEPSLLFPMTDAWKAGSGLGIGGLLKLSHSIDGDFLLHLRGGYIHHLTATELSIATSEVPLMFGFKYWFFDGAFSPYMTLEAGFTMLGIRNDAATDWGLKLSLGGGLGFSLGGLDLGAAFYAPSVGSFGDYIAVWLTLGIGLFSI